MDSFKEVQRKSRFIHQYKCSDCHNTWWGASKNNICRDCSTATNPLPLSKMVGVGWFQCPCSRRYAGFIRGNVTAKCHSCNNENLPLFIVPGDDAGKQEDRKHAHYCAVCRGIGTCPIVESAKRHGGGGGGKGRRF